MGSDHLSDSRVQQNAELAIIDALARHLDMAGGLFPKSLPAPGGTSVQVDGCSDDNGVLVEAYARQGKLKGGQIKKISQDILKLALLRQGIGLTGSRAIIAFASEEARGSITGWIRDAAEQFGVELLVVDISEHLREEIRSAQARQLMVNIEVPADELADDVTLESS